MKQTELNLDQLQQIKGGSKFWGSDCVPNNGGHRPVALETIDGVDNNVIIVCSYTCQNYIFGIPVGSEYQQDGGCEWAHFGL
jgi:hypothetical protein